MEIDDGAAWSGGRRARVSSGAGAGATACGGGTLEGLKSEWWRDESDESRTPDPYLASRTCERVVRSTASPR